jgi:NAD(P)-dependent dehydrogenase (short-subunit alcohol dehydrogenase family)
MDIEGSVALVTGANRGLGSAFARLLVERGAAKVYAAARNTDTLTLDGVIPVHLDITSAADIAAAAQRCDDVTLLINNAGMTTRTSALAGDADEAGHREMETNFFGTLAMSRAFAPILAGNGGGALVNVLSVVSWVARPANAMYSASKAASWSLTNALRVELAPRGTLVVGVHPGPIDTDSAAFLDGPKIAPADVATQTLDAVQHGRYEVLTDDTSRRVKAALAGDVTELYPSLIRAGAPLR